MSPSWERLYPTMPMCMDLTLVGDPALNSDEQSVQCHTDLESCCNSTQGNHHGDWYFPGGDDCYFRDKVILMRLVRLKELIYVVRTMLTHHLLYVVVIFQLIPSFN